MPTTKNKPGEISLRTPSIGAVVRTRLNQLRHSQAVQAMLPYFQLVVEWGGRGLSLLKEQVADQLKPTVVNLRQQICAIQNLTMEETADSLKQRSALFKGWLLSSRRPSVRKPLDFIGGEVVSNVVAWTAALLSSQLVSKYFTVKSWKNGWGLFGKKSKTLLSKEAYELLDWWAGYLIGLLILLLVRYLMKQWSLRAERKKEKKGLVWEETTSNRRESTRPTTPGSING